MIFVFRNSTLENFFPKEKYVFSEYDSPLSDETYENYLWMNFLTPQPSKKDLLKEISKLRNNLDVSLNTIHDKKMSILGLFTPEIYLSLTEKDDVEEEIYKFNQYVIQLSKDHPNIFYLNPETFKKENDKAISRSPNLSPMRWDTQELLESKRWVYGHDN